MITIRKAVIDSGPLLSALVLHYQRGRGRQPSLESFLEEPLLIRDHQEQFLNLLASIREKLTTSHVIGEIRGLAKRPAKVEWRRSSQFLARQHRPANAVET